LFSLSSFYFNKLLAFSPYGKKKSPSLLISSSSYNYPQRIFKIFKVNEVCEISNLKENI